MAAWTLAGHTLRPGEKARVLLNPNAPGHEMPATLIHGQSDGMTLLVTAGVHPDEYPGIAAAVRLGNALDPARLKGRLLLVHCVNAGGFWARRRVTPEDGFNLNAGYPGDPDGTIGQRIANFFVTEIFPKVDFVIDLHSGSPMEPLTPCLFFPNGAGERVREVSFEAAKAVDIPWLIASQATDGEYSYAATQMGIPGLLLERGHGGLCPEEWVTAYEADLYRLLAHFGMYPLPEGLPPVCGKTLCERTVYLESEHQGLWYPAADLKVGGEVRRGQLLGRMEDFWGHLLAEYRAEGDGVTFYHYASLAMRPGEFLIAYGLKDAMKNVM